MFNDFFILIGGAFLSIINFFRTLPLSGEPEESVKNEELDLKIFEKLNLDSGEIIIEGTINVLEYEEDSVQTKEGFFSRIFG